MPPDQSIIRVRDVIRRTGLGRTTIYRLEQKGEFPKRIKLTEGGYAVGWIEAEVDAWIHQLIRDAKNAERNPIANLATNGGNQES